MAIKSNPNVYPFTPFHDLSDRNFRAEFLPNLTLSTSDIGAILTNLPDLTIVSTGNPTADILNFFLSEPIRFGPKSLITDLKPFWDKKLDFFISQNIPIQFTILGFPFKIPVPLKTNRTYPDLGELLSLYHLDSICIAIAKVYPPGAKIHIFAEGVFGKFNQTDPTEYHNYKQGLDLIASKFLLNHISVHDLDEMESLSPNFNQLFEAKVTQLSTDYANNNPEIMKKYLGTVESILRIANTRILNLPNDILMDVYNSKLPKAKLTPEVISARKHIDDLVPKIIFNYLAYLSVRDDIHFLEKTVSNGLNLSVSPKKYRLGIQPISPEITRLPYHGVPVFHTKKNNFSIDYLIDLVRTPTRITPVYWSEDSEKLPFFYQI